MVKLKLGSKDAPTTPIAQEGAASHDDHNDFVDFFEDVEEDDFPDQPHHPTTVGVTQDTNLWHSARKMETFLSLTSKEFKALIYLAEFRTIYDELDTNYIKPARL